MLQILADELGRPAADLRIFDPYYCNGAVVRHLAALGFPRVHNRNEDFYAVQASGGLPAFDVLVTNPPYSADHPERLMRFCAQSGRPWMALMPNWVQARPSFDAASAPPSGDAAVVYLVPHKRYNYWTPRGRRSDLAAGGAKSKTHGHTNAALGVRTSPFVSFWYVGGLSAAARAQLRRLKPDGEPGVRVCWSAADLPPQVLDSA